MNTQLVFHFDLNFVNLRSDYIETWLERLASMGYTGILWEMEDKIAWENCPECVYPEAMSKEAFAALIAKSESLGLENIPFLQSFGHAEYVLKHEAYHHLRELPDQQDCYCTSNPDVRTFLGDWIDEICTLFNKPKRFHLGGDEAYVFASCPTCKARAEEIGRNELYAEHLNALTAPLLEQGIRPCIWNDMIMQHPESVACLSKELEMWDWNYHDGDRVPEKVNTYGKGWKTREELDPAYIERVPQVLDDNDQLNAFHSSAFVQSLGYQVVLCSSTRCFGDSVFCGRHEEHGTNVVGAARKSVKNDYLGTCVTSWAVRQHNLETQWPWIALAAHTLGTADKDFDTILKDTSEELFGIADKNFFDAIDKVGSIFLFCTSSTAGTHWSKHKDSTPAPKGFIADKVADLRKEGGNWMGLSWQDYREGLETSRRRIDEGLQHLKALGQKASRGFEILHAWERAAFHQSNRLHAASLAMRKAEGETFSKNELESILSQHRRQYLGWAEEWMTPQNAAHNTALIFDPLSEYLLSQ